MPKCENCTHWTVALKTIYGNGDEVVHWHAQPGKGSCSVLGGHETLWDFGCQAFLEGDCHESVSRKDGAPWDYWEHVTCPDCNGRCSLWIPPPPNAQTVDTGDYVCRRCAGLGRVRKYDDGFVGDEQTRLHPREKRPGPPKCVECKKDLDASWEHCPWCGHVTDTGRAKWTPGLQSVDPMVMENPLELSPSPIAGKISSAKLRVLDNMKRSQDDQGFL